MFQVIIRYQGDVARLLCTTLEEARQVRQSFINWGGLGYDIEIEQIKGK